MRQRGVLLASLDTITRLLHPVAPFITETLFEHLRRAPAPAVRGVDLPAADLLCRSAWPRISDSLRDPAAESEFALVQELVSLIREIRAQHQVQPKRRVKLHICDAAVMSSVSAHQGLIETLAVVGEITGEPALAARPR